MARATFFRVLMCLLLAHVAGYFLALAIFGYSPDRALLLNYLLDAWHG